MNTDEQVTMGEISRAVAEVRNELRALRADLVRRDVYEAQRASVAADIARLDGRLDGQDRDRATFRRQVTMAVLAAALSLGVQVVNAVFPHIP